MEPYGHLAQNSLPSDGVPACSVCGWKKIKVPKMFSVEEQSVPKNVDLLGQRGSQWVLFCTPS